MVRTRESRAKTCLFLPDVLIQCFKQSCMDDLAEDLAGYGEQSNASPVVAITKITLSGQFVSGIVSLSHISLSMHGK